MNTTLKHLGERGLVGSGLGRLALRARRGRTLVLAYHDILPATATPSGDESLHLAQPEFAKQLDALAWSHEVVPITSLFDAPHPAGRPRAIITFDDAYRGAVTVGVDELVKRGLPATIFVSPALLGSVPWWDTLADPGSGVVGEALRTHALEALSGKADLVLQSTPHTSPPRASLPSICTDGELATVARTAGISIGSHSWSHPNLCKLEPAELDAEMKRPLEWLRSRFASAVPWLSYPYGLNNETVQNAAAKVGYVGAFCIDGGWVARRSPLPTYSLPRLNIPSGLSIDGFRLRIAGL